MRILFLVGEYPPDADNGGIGSYVAAAAQALGDAGHDAHVLVVNPHQPTRDERTGAVHVHRRPTHRPARLARGRTLGRVASGLSTWLHARRLGPFDVIEAPDWQAAGLGFALMQRTPLVVCLHTPDAVIARERDGVVRSLRWSDRLEAWTAARADVVTTSFPLLVDELRALGWLRRDREVSLVLPPMEPDAGPQAGECGSDDADMPVVLGVGRVERRKGFDRVVGAVGELVRRGTGARVVLVGAVADERSGRAVAALADELGVDLTVTGVLPPDEVARWYRRARVVAVPSRFDSVPMVALEALAAGTPVVCSDRCGVAALAGRSPALVAAPGDPGPLADALGPYLLDADLAAGSGEEGRELVREMCSTGRFVAARLADYERAAAGRAASAG